MQYSNHYLAEVNCGFHFSTETTDWDSTFFGQFYEKIKERGFTERQERKGVQISFDGSNIDETKITRSEIQDQVVFKNNATGMAIAMGKNKISFHQIKNYTNWNDFVKNLIDPISKVYKALGLGNGDRQCNIVYLNQFVKPNKEMLSDYFTITSPIESKFGLEVNTTIQRIIENENNYLIAKLNSQNINTSQNINLECGAICKNIICLNNSDWIDQANQTHEPIKDFFESIITEKLRKEL